MYVDTSILVKLLVAEPDSEICAAKVAGASVVSSELAYAETFSALLQKERAGAISASRRNLSWAEFERQIGEEAIFLASLDTSIVQRAQNLMFGLHPRVPLRTLDALHLATCLSVIAGPLYTNDGRMKEAARLLDIPLVE